MAKKKGKNLQKLLKNKQLQQLQIATDKPIISLGEKPQPPKIAPQPELPKLPTGEGRPIIKTLISTAIIVAILIGVSVSSSSQDYLTRFGDWLYSSLELSN